jgi:hypothetical protein
MNRIYHPWDKWECINMYLRNEKLDFDDCIIEYKMFLSNLKLFERYLKKVLKYWPISCEHFLSNENMNRIAWLGQASMCFYSGIPCFYRSGYKLLSNRKAILADKMADKYLKIWVNRYEKAHKALH